MDMQDALKKILKKNLNLDVSYVEIHKLFGHASYRTYYRVNLQDGKTYVLMQMPPGKASVSEEITNYKGQKEELPYLNIQRYLKSVGLPVPEVYAWTPEENLMILEDLGDRLLESYVKDAEETIRIFFYKKAVDLLVDLQKKSQENPDERCIAFHRSFDKTLLNWEFDHFLEYGIEDRFQMRVSAEEKKLFTNLTRQITQEIVNSPYLFVHRDYQSRNLILKDYHLYLLDFQDALMGPQAYDLVALLRDSYVELNSESVETLIRYFLEARKKSGLPIEDEKKFRWLFYLTTLQRKLKDTGRFQFIHTVKGNSNFLVHVPTSLRYVKVAFEKLTEFEALKKFIEKYVPELR